MSRFLMSVFLLVNSSLLFWAQNPCAEPHARALVMSGGGSKGAFQAGAAYHLVVHRGCDFSEISGTSAGALNSAVLAQAAKSAEPEVSLASLRIQSEALVKMWQSVKSSKEIVKGRPFSGIRFGAFGLESMKNFDPLHKLIERELSAERLDNGRELRVGTISFYDGVYREVVLNSNGRTDPHAVDYIFGSAMIPMFGTMPRISVANSGLDASAQQFGDGGLRHGVPVRSYFPLCAGSQFASQCRDVLGPNAVAHSRIEQIFVIATSPIVRNSDLKPVSDESALKSGTRQITDGRKIMGRAIDVIMDSIYRSDFDYMWLANDLLRWRQESSTSDTPEFPIESYNYDPLHPETASKPYRIGVIAPARDESEMSKVFDFSPVRMSRQMYCGCVAANDMMQKEFRVDSQLDRCADDFRKPKMAGKSHDSGKEWNPGVCAEIKNLDVMNIGR